MNTHTGGIDRLLTGFSSCFPFFFFRVAHVWTHTHIAQFSCFSRILNFNDNLAAYVCYLYLWTTRAASRENYFYLRCKLYRSNNIILARSYMQIHILYISFIFRIFLTQINIPLYWSNVRKCNVCIHVEHGAVPFLPHIQIKWIPK